MAKLALLLSATCTVLINNYIFSKYHKYCILLTLCASRKSQLSQSQSHYFCIQYGTPERFLMEKFCNQWCKVKLPAVTIHWPAWGQKMAYTVFRLQSSQTRFSLTRLLIYAALCTISVLARVSAASQGRKHDLKHLFTLQVLFFLDYMCVNARLKGNKKALNHYIYILQRGGAECAVVNSHRLSNFLNIEVLRCLFMGKL